MLLGERHLDAMVGLAVLGDDPLAYHGQALDRPLLEPRLPAAIFYNLLMSALKPGRRRPSSPRMRRRRGSGSLRSGLNWSLTARLARLIPKKSSMFVSL